MTWRAGPTDWSSTRAIVVASRTAAAGASRATAARAGSSSETGSSPGAARTTNETEPSPNGT
jgi:hypothetical protein